LRTINGLDTENPDGFGYGWDVGGDGDGSGSPSSMLTPHDRRVVAFGLLQKCETANVKRNTQVNSATHPKSQAKPTEPTVTTATRPQSSSICLPSIMVAHCGITADPEPTPKSKPRKPTPTLCGNPELGGRTTNALRLVGEELLIKRVENPLCYGI